MIYKRINIVNILECTTKPIIYGGFTSDKYENIIFTIRKLELMGISSIIIEDKYKNKKELCNEEEFCLKIKEGKKAQTNPNFMIIAGIEELVFGHNIDDALKKAFASIKAGADGILISSNQKNGDDIKNFCLKLRKENKSIPIILIPTTINQFTEKEFSEWGANIIIYADYLKKVTYKAMKKCAETILNSERSLEVNEMCMPIKEILNLIPGTN